MTEEQLYLRRGLEREIQDVTHRLERAKARAVSTVWNYSASPSASGVSDKVGSGAIEVIYLTELLARLEADKIERDRYIASFEDSEVRQAMRMHYVDGMPWRNVGWRLHYSHEGIRRKVEEAIKCKNAITGE